jgi:hypothetical protein
VAFLTAIALALVWSVPFLVSCREKENNAILAVLLVVGAGNTALAAAARKDINRAPEALIGTSLALTGLYAGPLCVVFSVFHPTWDCILREPSPNTLAANDLKQIGLAFHQYHQDHGHLPGSAIRSPDGRPLLSWRVAILPYVESEELYQRFHLDEPWDSPHNFPLLSRMPKVYADSDQDPSEGATRFQVYVGPGSAFGNPRGHTLADFASESKKTVLVVEGEQRVPWTKPIDLAFGPEVLLVQPHVRQMAKVKRFWALSADGACHAMPADTPEETLRALITRNGEEHFEWP